MVFKSTQLGQQGRVDGQLLIENQRPISSRLFLVSIGGEDQQRNPNDRWPQPSDDRREKHQIDHREGRDRRDVSSHHVTHVLVKPVLGVLWKLENPRIS